MKRGRAVVILSAAVLLTVLTGCASSASSFSATWGSAASGKPSITIADDGSYSGTDGCNRLTGKGSESSGTFTFGPIASTLMACSGVDTWLSKAVTATVSGRTLTVFGSGGAKLGTLDRR